MQDPLQGIGLDLGDRISGADIADENARDLGGSPADGELLAPGRTALSPVVGDDEGVFRSDAWHGGRGGRGGGRWLRDLGSRRRTGKHGDGSAAGGQECGAVLGVGELALKVRDVGLLGRDGLGRTGGGAGLGERAGRGGGAGLRNLMAELDVSHLGGGEAGFRFPEIGVERGEAPLQRLVLRGGLSGAFREVIGTRAHGG